MFAIFGSCMPSNTTHQFIVTNTLYGQHVSAIAISYHQASHRKRTSKILRTLLLGFCDVGTQVVFTLRTCNRGTVFKIIHLSLLIVKN
jgi:hypothetical protein